MAGVAEASALGHRTAARSRTHNHLADTTTPDTTAPSADTTTATAPSADTTDITAPNGPNGDFFF
jgi:hypothetical protein